MRLLHFALAAAAFALAGCDSKPSEPSVTVEEVWVQLPAIPGRPGAAYFTLTANGDSPRLMSVSSPRIQKIELHDTMMKGSMAKMRPMQNAVFEGGKLAFAPGGKHAMLFGIDPGLKARDKIPLTFTLEPAPPVTVEAEVRAFGEDIGGH
jgi:periplasmic copper chaperone A